MKLSFEVSLSDLATAIEYQDGSDSERQEVMDFLVTVDECMADYVFSQELIYRLSVSLAEESEDRGWQPVTLPEGGATTFSRLYETLTHMPEGELIALMANAMMVSRERALSEAKAKVDQVMEDFSSWEKSKPLPLSTECVCGCPEAAHE